ncbi:uroporphyrinogen-III C-methyltransferase [Salinarimonas rosea]|uniref:uroporphyrinogen-III C-methyltransferase n=1 Tax=Salinarimonas rosea TaxID=552063 RepID=UPI00041910D9|nr:uroporphyrinogen-III C-methyltransferase [Salinarimonas rosea]
MTDLSRLSPVFSPGTVWLVGAGPGDPGLLTVHALNALALADVVVHDALIGEGVLGLAREGAVLEYAGKRGGRPSARQDAICERLIALARSGKRVLRLKGGDPFVFGRGGEEALALAQAGISFRIVPGVSSGLAALAQHGVPATTRDTNHAVILATGHCAEDDESVDWAALARAGVPIVLYMAVANLAPIAHALIRGGLSPTTPTLVVHGATTPRETLLEAPLAQLPALAETGAVASPAIVAIGAIAAFRQAIAGHVEAFRTAAAG